MQRYLFYSERSEIKKNAAVEFSFDSMLEVRVFYSAPSEKFN